MRPQYSILGVSLLFQCVISVGINYSPWHHTELSKEILQKDLSQVKLYFESIRTFHAKFNDINVIDAAAEAGLKVMVGINMQANVDIDNEINAACDGAKRHPETVDAIMVGNENVMNPKYNFGTISSSDLINRINQVKACVNELKIQVGTAQRVTEWLDNSDEQGMKSLADAIDIIGVNIYPFFTGGEGKSWDKYMNQWNAMNDKYNGKKMACTESGWPRHGSTMNGNTPSKEATQEYFNEFKTWDDKEPNINYYFMMFDTTNTYGGGDFETSFGVADKDGVMQIDIPLASPQSAPSTEPPTTALPPPETTTVPPTTTPSPTVTTAELPTTTEPPKISSPTPASSKDIDPNPSTYTVGHTNPPSTTISSSPSPDTQATASLTPAVVPVRTLPKSVSSTETDTPSLGSQAQDLCRLKSRLPRL